MCLCRLCVCPEYIYKHITYNVYNWNINDLALKQWWLRIRGGGSHSTIVALWTADQQVKKLILYLGHGPYQNAG